MIHSTDGTNTPLFKREVSDDDFHTWRDNQHVESNLPTPYRKGQYVWFRLWSHDIAAMVLCVHDYGEKFKYDLELLGNDGQTTRIYNVESQYVQDRIPEYRDNLNIEIS